MTEILGQDILEADTAITPEELLEIETHVPADRFAKAAAGIVAVNQAVRFPHVSEWGPTYPHYVDFPTDPEVLAQADEN